MNIVFCASEATPFVKTGGLADVAGSLPDALGGSKCNVSIFLPLYKAIKDKKINLQKISSSVYKLKGKRNPQVYFVEHLKYFNRSDLYGDKNGDYKDNLERFSFFSNQILKFLKNENIKPDVVHSHDWHTSLIPVYLKEKYSKDKFFKDTKTVLTIHNLAYQGVFDKSDFKKMGLSRDLYNVEKFEYYNQINILKAGIIYCDVLTTVSQRYASEIKTRKYGCGLDGVIKHYKKDVSGVLNGLDYGYWNPQTDKFIYKKFSKRNFRSAKKINKLECKKEFYIKTEENKPLFGFVGRLSHQKGVDLILKNVSHIIKSGGQIVIQGVGDQKYLKKLKELENKYAGDMVFIDEFDEVKAHKIYAASDFFLMPSEFEPCGLGQMIALAYAVVPIVSKVGGLIDTIVTNKKDESYGISLSKNTSKAFKEAINDSLKLFKNKDLYLKYVRNGLKVRFTWEKSAKEYKRIYACLQ